MSRRRSRPRGFPRSPRPSWRTSAYGPPPRPRTRSLGAWRSITVEMTPPRSHIDDDRSDDEVGEECPICFKEFVVGSGAAVKLSCSRAFHRTCLDKWVSKKRTCPYYRSPVPQGVEILLHEDYPELEEDDDSGEHSPLHGDC